MVDSTELRSVAKSVRVRLPPGVLIWRVRLVVQVATLSMWLRFKSLSRVRIPYTLPHFGGVALWPL